MTLRRIGFGFLALALLVVAGLGVLAWRLDRGPIAVPALVPRLEAALDPEGPARIEIAGAEIGWRGWEDRGIAPLEVHLTGLTALDAEREPWLEAPTATVALRPFALLRRRVAPQRIEIRGAELRLRREADGRLVTGLGPPGGGGNLTLADLARPEPGSPFATLEHVAILDGRLRVLDAQLGQDWALRDIFLAANRGDAGALRGEASGTLAVADQVVPLRLAASLAPEPLQLRLDLALPQVNPAALARAVPELAPLAVLDASADLAAAATLDADLRPVEGSVALRSEAGAVDLPTLGHVPFRALALRLAGTPQAVRLELLRLNLPPAPETPAGSAGPTLTAEGQATQEEGRWRAEADLTLDRAMLAALDTWWPSGLAQAGRGWVAENLVGGVLSAGRWHIAATAPDSLDQVELTELSGTARLDDLAVRWHPELPPLEGLSGDVTFTPDGITLAAEEARQAGTALRLTDGRLKLAGLGPGPARAELQGQLAGPVADLWAVLREPGLGLLAGRDLPIRDPTGAVTAEVAATVPLSGRFAAQDPFFRATAQLSDLRLPDVVLGQTLRDGSFELTLNDDDGLRAEGTGILGEVPVRTEIAVDFPDAPGEPTGVVVTARGRPQAAQLAAFGFDPGGVVRGPVELDLRYETRGEAPARLAVEADLEAAEVTLVPLGYRKAPGRAASAAAVLRLREGGVGAVESLQANGPALRLRAAAPEGVGAGATLVIREARFGETRLTGRLRRPEAAGGAWSATVQGPVVDLRPLLSRAGAREGARAGARGGEARNGDGTPPFVLDARFERALMPDGASPLRGLQAQLTFAAGGALHQAQVAAQASEHAATRFAASLAPAQQGGRLLRVQAGDAGALLAALGYGRRIEGGRLELAAVMPDGAIGLPIEGTAELADFTVRDAPAVGKLLQALTGYGLLEALQGPGLSFSRLVLPFRLERDALLIGEARAFSASLGLTATGRIDRRQEVLDLQGTVVPAYVFNSLLGNLPIVGRLFSAERGGGLFSAAFTVTGPIADPQVSVNPLSALTPGFLRGIFDLGNGDAGATGGEAPAAPAGR
ncbi:AsmA-like C-terminal region-containing protein [Falsiroseomonas sp.]|uniref:YhdP family protein n=1 Tax=Falsiroseomonas sp. TaxID=2870721 RepID=UPI00356A3A41